MSERELYISIIPDIAELIVLLRDMSQQERTQIKDEMIKNCKKMCIRDRPHIVGCFLPCGLSIKVCLKRIDHLLILVYLDTFMLWNPYRATAITDITPESLIYHSSGI